MTSGIIDHSRIPHTPKPEKQVTNEQKIGIESAPEGSVAPPDGVAAPRVAILEGLASLPELPIPFTEESRSLYEEARRDETRIVELLDPATGRALFRDRNWGEIFGTVNSNSRGGSYFAADNARVQAHPAKIEDGVVILSGAFIEENVEIGRGSIIGVGTLLRGNVVIGHFVEIGSGVRLNGGDDQHQKIEIGDRCKIGDEVLAGPAHGQQVFSIELGADCMIGERTSLKGSARIGRNVSVGARCALEGVSVERDLSIGSSSTVCGPALPQATVRASLKAGSFLV